MKLHGFDAVDRVEHSHGYRFVQEFLRYALATEATTEAYGQSGIATYPGDDGPAHERFSDIQDEIVTVTFARARRAIIEAFVATANEVLARERSLLDDEP